MFSTKLLNLSSVKSALASRSAGIIVVAVAVLAKCLIAWIYNNAEGDKSLYLLFAQSFRHTGILAEPFSLIENGSTIQTYNPAIYSPLYSLLAAPLLWATSSYYITQLLLSFAGWLLFFTALYKVAALVFAKPWLTRLFILCTGFFLYPHELDAGPKDTLAAAFTLWSIYFSYRFIVTPAQFGGTFLLAVCISGLCLSKLIYLPAAGILLCLLFIFLLRKKSRFHWRQFTYLSILLLTIAASTYCLLILPAKQLPPFHAAAATNDGTVAIRGFYPQNLSGTFPVISSSFINTTFWGVQLQNISGVPFITIIRAFQLLDVALLAMLVAALVRYKKRPVRKIILLLIAAAITIASVVFYLSLTFQAFAYKSSTGLFTFVADARSFLIPMIALQLLLFLFVFKSGASRILRIGFFLLFLFECCHGIYFTAKQTAHAGEIRSAVETSSPLKKIVAKLALLNAEKNGCLLLTTDNFIRRYALIDGQSAYTFSSAAGYLSWMKKGSRLLIVTHVQDSAVLKIFPAQKLMNLDTIKPYVLHLYEAN